MSEVAVAGIGAPIVIADAQPRHSLTADIVHGAEAFAALVPEWEYLARRQTGTIVFQTPSLLSIWADHFARQRLVSFTTVVVRNAGRPILIWPIRVERFGPIRIACGAGAPISQYDEILVDPEACVRTAMSVALDVLKKTVRPDFVMFERVRADSELRKAVRDATQVGCEEGAPYLDLSRGLEAALKSRKSYAAKQQKKRMKRFAKEGESTVTVAQNAAEAEAWLSEALTLKRNWLTGNGMVSRAFVNAATGTCLRDLARKLSAPDASPRMVVAKLALNGKTAAIEAGFAYRDSFHLYLRAFAPQFSNLGPGNVLTEHMVGWCVDNGFKRYDMLAPRSRNKAEWQSDEVGVTDLVVPMTWLGRLFTATVPTHIAPKLRDAFYALPLRIRSAVAGMTLRM
jgi:CelD/BcsL family acetyltransferase involved in cellulose biosynthesis